MVEGIDESRNEGYRYLVDVILISTAIIIIINNDLLLITWMCLYHWCFALTSVDVMSAGISFVL